MEIEEIVEEYTRVKVIVTKGDVETVFDIPMVTDGVEFETNYEEPEIDLLSKKYDRRPQVKSLVFTMHPVSNGESYMLITRTAMGRYIEPVSKEYQPQQRVLDKYQAEIRAAMKVRSEYKET